MNKRIPYAIIPKYLKTYNDIDNRANIKVDYGNWSVKKNYPFAAAKFRNWDYLNRD